MSFLFSFDVLQRLNRKEPGARSWVYNKYYSYVYGLVRRITDSSPDSRDLVADVFVKLFEYSGRFESLDKVKYFLYAITKSTCIDYARHRHVVREKLYDIRRNTSIVEENEFEKAQAKAAFQQLIYSSIEELPRQCRYIFIMYYSRGLNNSQIAARLHISEKTVSNQKTIALKMLKMKIGKMSRHLLTLAMSLHYHALIAQVLLQVFP